MSVNKCSCSDCELEVWKEYDKCVLHCSKNIYQNDRHDGTLSEFGRKFKQYIIEKLVVEHYCDDEVIDEKIIAEEINSNNIEKMSELKNCFIKIDYMAFPHRDGRDSYDYLKVLNLFGEIHFDYCEFYETELKLPDIKVFFQDCIFKNGWYLYDYRILKNQDDVIYQTCRFHKLVSVYLTGEDDISVLSYSQFDYTCIFDEGLELDFVQFNEALFNTNQENYQENYVIKYIKFECCIFEKKFELMNCKIDILELNKNTFKNKIECKYNIIQKFTIDDSNFEKLVDFYRTEFIEFKIYKSIFKDFVGFERCEFGTLGVSEECISRFQYVTFLDFTNFRDTKFKSGLDIENINVKEYPNFLNTEIDEFNTNRETFRVLKYSFDKNGNYLEGNKYFSLEMKKYGKELYLSPLKGHVQEKLIFWVNEKVSNFGQSWGRPVAWIILFIIIYGFIIYGNEHHWLMHIYPKGSEVLNTIMHWLNYPLKDFRPLEKILKKDYEFMSLVFNIIFSVLIWQTIVAVKRHTKR
jgi:hypothetical protein